ncbi:MAG TPA: response regulator [Elusimicrobiota bacterium]|jgi:CheY-like chemotaxis protein|nr:response regulator [Elusimicrobiota bacterium]
MPDYTYTTHDVARYCDVYPSTVLLWIKSGKLKSFSTPGGHHRMARADVISLVESMGMPLHRELSAPPRRVMIVDDDPEVTRVLVRAFARSGDVFSTEVCHDGVEALIRIGQAPPDLVILDLILPKMDGLQVCRVLKAKEQTRGAKIIAISGKKPPFDEATPSEAKIDAFYRKPLDLAELVGEAAKLLRVDLAAAGKKDAAAR